MAEVFAEAHASTFGGLRATAGVVVNDAQQLITALHANMASVEQLQSAIDRLTAAHGRQQRAGNEARILAYLAVLLAFLSFARDVAVDGVTSDPASVPPPVTSTETPMPPPIEQLLRERLPEVFGDR